MNEKLETEIQDSLVDGKLPCAVAFNIAKKLKPRDGSLYNKQQCRFININWHCVSSKLMIKRSILCSKRRKPLSLLEAPPE